MRLTVPPRPACSRAFVEPAASPPCPPITRTRRPTSRCHERRLGLRRRRRRHRGLRAREPAVRRRPPYGAAARGRAARRVSLDPRADRLREDDVPPGLQLAIQDRARARDERPRDLLALGPDAGRFQRDQRAHLHPRPSRRLRSLGVARQRRLGLRGRAALFPQARAQRARRVRVARRRRPAVGVRHPREARAGRGVDRRRDASSAFRATTTSTARRRKAPATTS